MNELSLFEILTLVIGSSAAVGTIGSCIIALNLIDIKRFRIKPCKYTFEGTDHIKFKIINKNSDQDLIIRNIFLTARHREITDFHLNPDEESKNIIEMCVMPGSFYCNKSGVYRTRNKDYFYSNARHHKTFKDDKPLKIVNIVKEWKKSDKNIGNPQLYFDTNFGQFTSSPSKEAKKIWKQHLKN